ncbi:MAG: hypothetical protein AAB871_01555, partial [Patescibacteria group bacterium]
MRNSYYRLTRLKEKTFFYRFLETIPGLLTWGTFLSAILLSYWRPMWVAFFIIIFDLYWVLKAVNIGLHLTFAHQKISIHSNYDWLGQDVKRLAKWVKENEIKKVYTQVFTNVPLGYYLGEA